MDDKLVGNGPEIGNQEPAKAEVDKTKSITYGFDEEGFFNFKIHVTAGSQMILGWLEICKDVVKTHYVNMARQDQDKKLIRPERPAKGLFNKWR